MARPEAYRLDGAGVEARLVSARFAGGYVDVLLQAGGVVGHAHAPAGWTAAGDTLRVSLDPTFCAVFPAA